MKDAKTDSVFTKTRSSFAFEQKAQARSACLNRTGPAKANAGSFASGFEIHPKPVVFRSNILNLQVRLDGIPIFVSNRRVDCSKDFGLAAHNSAQKTGVGFEQTGEVVGG